MRVYLWLSALLLGSPAAVAQTLGFDELLMLRDADFLTIAPYLAARQWQLKERVFEAAGVAHNQTTVGWTVTRWEFTTATAAPQPTATIYFRESDASATQHTLVYESFDRRVYGQCRLVAQERRLPVSARSAPERPQPRGAGAYATAGRPQAPQWVVYASPGHSVELRIDPDPDHRSESYTVVVRAKNYEPLLFLPPSREDLEKAAKGQ